jgi:hypothetical protein
MLAVAAVLIAAAILAIGYVGLSLLQGTTSTATPAAAIAAAVAVQPPALATPIDLAQFHATAEAGLNRPAEQRQAVPSTPTPVPAPTKPVAAPAKPGAPKPGEVAKPGAPAAVPGTPTPERTARPTLTVPPTRTPTVSHTATSTETPTPTPTYTPLPSPCEAPVEVPRVFVGNGFFITVTHEVGGNMAVRWNVQGGEIRVFQDRPPWFGAERSGVVEGIPPETPIQQGLSGPRTLNVGDRGPGEYTFYFFNGSPLGLGPVEAEITYWTYGHCP